MRKFIMVALLAAGFLAHESTHVKQGSPESAGQAALRLEHQDARQSPAAPESAKLPSTRACAVLMDYFSRVGKTPEEKKAAVSGTVRFSSGQLRIEMDPAGPAQSCDFGSHPAEVVIAMAPHPVNSNLALTFDREIESIQRAAAGAGYDFHQHYFPWTAPAAAQTGAVQNASESHGNDREPGLLLFRGPQKKSPLLVLVLPETPSGYLDPVTFQTAMSYALQFEKNSARTSKTIRILGPFASGTVSALKRLLQEWRESQEDQDSIAFDIISGSATAKATLDQLAAVPYVRFHSVLHDDEAVLAAFRQYFGRDARIVLLSESGTAYGAQGQHLQIPSIGFPREMSRLRNAYSQLPGLPQPADARTPQPSLRLLPLDLRDSSPAQDIVRTFSGSHLAASQEAVLLNIADQLRRERVQFAGILATDVLDGIFLAKFIGSSCPNVRLFTLDPDLLVARAAEELPFTGVLTLGTYPLLPRAEPLVMQGAVNSLIHFPSQNAAGAYDAMRALLNRGGLCCKAEDGPLFKGRMQAGDGFEASLQRDSEQRHISFVLPPSFHASGSDQRILSAVFQNIAGEWAALNGEWAATIAGGDRLEIAFDSSGLKSNPPPQVLTVVKTSPLWISVLSPRGYWPVASIQSPGFPPFTRPGITSGFEQPSGAWKFLFFALSVLVLGFAAAVWHDSSATGAREFYKAPYLSAARSAEQGRVWYLLIATASLSFLYVTLVAPLWLLRTGLSGAAPVTGVILFLAAIAALLFTAGRLLKELAGSPPDATLSNFGAVCMTAFGIVCLYIFDLLRLRDTHYQKVFAAYRTFDPLSGVSPAVPVQLIAAVVFCWAVVHAKRLWMTSFKPVEDLPAIQPDANLEADRDLKQLRQATEKAIEMPFFKISWRVVPAVAIFFIVVGLRGLVFDSFEPPEFAAFYTVLTGMAAAVLFLTWSRFLLIWGCFSDFLEELASQSLRSALENLPRTHSWSAIFQSPALLEKRYWAERAEETWKRVESIANAAAAGADAISTPAAPVTPNPETGRMRTCLDLVKADWSRGTSESWSRTKAAREKHLTVSAIDETDARSIAAGEFVAQPFHRFITYVLLHMRNLLFFISIGFTLLTLSLFSFPFQSHHLLSAVAVGWLVVLGASLVYVFAQVDRNEVLSWMNDTTPGQVGSDFYVKILSYGAIPLVTLLSTQFPSVSRTLLDWIQPFSQALK